MAGDDDDDGDVDAGSVELRCDDWANPVPVDVGDPVAAPVPEDGCTYFFRFTPPATGVYSIEKTGGGTLAFCPPGFDDGCICAAGSNCCADCDLTFDLADGSPLEAGTNHPLYLSPNNTGGEFHFEVTGPQ